MIVTKYHDDYRFVCMKWKNFNYPIHHQRQEVNISPIGAILITIFRLEADLYSLHIIDFK